MPTYEYECEKCGHTFEVFQPITGNPLKTCTRDACPLEKWGRGRVRRGISGGAGLLFKGSGFYITDYRSEGYKQAAKQESSAGKKEPSPAKPSADSPAKPASPAASPPKS